MLMIIRFSMRKRNCFPNLVDSTQIRSSQCQGYSDKKNAFEKTRLFFRPDKKSPWYTNSSVFLEERLSERIFFLMRCESTKKRKAINKVELDKKAYLSSWQMMQFIFVTRKKRNSSKWEKVFFKSGHRCWAL